MNRTPALRTIWLGGLVVGALDGAAAVTDAALHGVGPTRLFQFVAAGLLGRASFQGGLATVLLGVFLEFFIALCVMATYYGASRRFPVLVRHAVVCGMLYGIFVFSFMNILVVPLSSAPRGPFHLSRWLTQVFIHMFFVGLPAALVTRASTRRRTSNGV
jgi:hypothetical protein